MFIDNPGSIGMLELKAELKNRVDMGVGTVIDWNDGISFVHDALTSNITFTDDNLPTGADSKPISIDIDLATFTANFPAYYVSKGGEASTSGKTRIIIDCVNGTASSEEVYYELNPNA